MIQRDLFVWICVSVCFSPRCHLPCRGRRWRCCSGRLWSRPVAASLSLPASYSSCWDTQSHIRLLSEECLCVCMWEEVGCLLLHLPTFSNIFQCSLDWQQAKFEWWLRLTWWVTPLRNRNDALCPHSVWLYIVSGPPPPLWGCPEGNKTATLVTTWWKTHGDN